MICVRGEGEEQERVLNRECRRGSDRFENAVQGVSIRQSCLLGPESHTGEPSHDMTCTS